MSAILPIEVDSGAWRLLVKYVDERVAELTEVCCSPGSTDEQRLTAAHRIDELKEMLKAPQRTRASVQQRMTYQPDKVY